MTAVLAVLASFDVIVPVEWTELIIAAGVLLVGFLASDKKKP